MTSPPEALDVLFETPAPRLDGCHSRLVLPHEARAIHRDPLELGEVRSEVLDPGHGEGHGSGDGSGQEPDQKLVHPGVVVVAFVHVDKCSQRWGGQS